MHRQARMYGGRILATLLIAGLPSVALANSPQSAHENPTVNQTGVYAPRPAARLSIFGVKSAQPKAEPHELRLFGAAAKLIGASDGVVVVRQSARPTRSVLRRGNR